MKPDGRNTPTGDDGESRTCLVRWEVPDGICAHRRSTGAIAEGPPAAFFRLWRSDNVRIGGRRWSVWLLVPGVEHSAQ